MNIIIGVVDDRCVYDSILKSSLLESVPVLFTTISILY